MNNFILHALIAGLMIAIITGLIGCFIVWRRMAYFGDSLAHSTFLGIAIGLISGLNMTISILLISLIFSGLLLWLQHKRIIATDALLGILAHGALSTAIVVMALAEIPIDLHTLLFGDILTVTIDDLWIIAGGGIVILATITFFWQPLLLMTINQDLAKAEGVNTLLLHIIFLVLIATTVALSVRIVGVLLITSMLIIPAATARQFARTPLKMLVMAVFTGALAVLLGILLSIQINTPTGPSMVLCLAVIFALSIPISYIATRLIAHRKATIIKS